MSPSSRLEATICKGVTSGRNARFLITDQQQLGIMGRPLKTAAISASRQILVSSVCGSEYGSSNLSSIVEATKDIRRQEFWCTEALSWLSLDPGISQALITSTPFAGSQDRLP